MSEDQFSDCLAVSFWSANKIMEKVFVRNESGGELVGISECRVEDDGADGVIVGVLAAVANESFTGFLMPVLDGLPLKFVARPNGFRLETRPSSVGSPFALTFSKIGTASFRRTRMS